MKTVLVEGVGWPEVGEWPVRFEHKEKPKRVIKPKAKPKPKEPELRIFRDHELAAARKQLETGEAKSKHKHAAKNVKRPNLAPKEFFIFSKARSYK